MHSYHNTKLIILLLFSLTYKIAISQNHSNLYSWGNNSDGQLGLGFSDNPKSPVKSILGSNWKMLLPLTEGVLGIKNDGTLWAYGKQNNGELGTNNINTDIPIQVGKDTNWLNLYSGTNGTNVIGLKSDGSLWAWGFNSNGSLGLGHYNTVYIPQQIGNSKNWSFVYRNGSNTYCIKNDSTLWAWGDNSIGQLGLGNKNKVVLPTQVGSDNQWKIIQSDGLSTIGLKTDGTIWAWGNNSYGQLGLGNKFSYLIPTQIGADTNWHKISFDGNSAFAIKKDGSLWSWGQNSYGKLGLGTFISPYLSPQRVGDDFNWSQIFQSKDSKFGIKSNNTLWAWGYNGGDLGIGYRDTRSAPTQIGTDSNWSQIFCWNNGTKFAIKMDGSLWSWGSNFLGTMGVGNVSEYSTPQKIESDIDWLNCYKQPPYGSLIYAIKNDGSVWQWGGNEIKSYPINKISNDFNWIKISTGLKYSLAIKENGTLWAWGLNDSGQLGLGDLQERNAPTQIGVDTNWLYISAGGKHVLGLKKDGTLWTWGGNHRGQLGIGYQRDTIIFNPLRIGTDTDWKLISCGNKTSFAIKNNNTLWGWGYGNSYSNSDFKHSVPTKIGTDTNWKFVSAGLDRILFSAIKLNNTVWMSTIRENRIQINDHFTQPFQIGNDTNWLTTTTGESKVYALKNDRSLWECNNDSLTTFRKLDSDKWKSIEASRTTCVGLKTNGQPYLINLIGDIDVLDSNSDWIAVSSHITNSNLSLADMHGLGIRKTIIPTTELKSLKTQHGIYPVPTDRYLSFLNLNRNKIIFEIYNYEGKQILMGETSEKIDVSDLPIGVYILKTNIGEFKFIKE